MQAYFPFLNNEKANYSSQLGVIQKVFPNVTPSKDPADFKKVFLETQLGACLTCFNSEAKPWEKLYLNSCFFTPSLNYLCSVTIVLLVRFAQMITTVENRQERLMQNLCVEGRN